MDLTFLDRATFDTDTLAPDLDPTYAVILSYLDMARPAVYAAHHPATFTEYQIANFLADYAVALQRALVKPLHIGDLLPLGRSRGMTEWGAKILMTYGYIPGAVYPESLYWLPRKYARLPIVDKAWVESTPQPKYCKIETRRRCTACSAWHDLTSEYWHRDPKGRLGWQTICRNCRNEARRLSYQRSVAA